MADLIEQRLGPEFELKASPEELASVFNAITDGMALERLLDPGCISDEAFGHVLAAIVEAFTTRRHS
jgi:hypothetical protein